MLPPNSYLLPCKCKAREAAQEAVSTGNSRCEPKGAEEMAKDTGPSLKHAFIRCLYHGKARGWSSPLSTVVELMQQPVSQKRAVLVDEQVLAAIDAH